MMISDKMDSISSRTSCFAEQNNSCKASCSENDSHHNDDNTLPLNLVRRFPDSSTFPHNGEVDESVSAGADTSQACRTPPERKFEELDSSEDRNSEESFSELIFSSLLELIISTKLMEMSVNSQAADPDRATECKTPINLQLLTGIAGTCPPAPIRRTLFVKGFDHSICRKLDFEKSLI